MYPTIHDWKLENVNSQGYGALSDCLSCEVTEELNGAYTLELTYPLKGLHANYLVPGNVIVTKPNHNQGRQAFRISQVKQSFANNYQVYANHICYDLSGYYMRGAYSYTDITALFTAMDGYVWTDSPYYHQFHFATDITSSTPFSMPPAQTLRSYMGGQEGSILDTYGGEWIYDNFSCFLASRRGTDTGYRISYGKNLSEYEKQRDYNTYSHLCAYYKKDETYTFSNIIATGQICPFRTGYYDASNEYEEQPTTEQLNASAEAQIAKMNPLAQTVTVTPAQLGNDVIGLGDSVLICYDVIFQIRVIKTVWDSLRDEYKSMVLGTKKANITDTIKSLK